MQGNDIDYENEMINKEIYGGKIPEDIALNQASDDLDDDLKGK